jgi:hypothetical protein
MSIFKADGVDGHNANLVKTVTVWATDAITIGDTVMIDTTVVIYGYGYAVKQSDTVNSPLAVGTALETVTGTPTAPQQIQIQYAGPVGDTALDSAFRATPTASGLISAGGTVGSGVGGIIRPSASTGINHFAVCVAAYSGATDDGAIMIIDKGFYM